MNTQSCLSDADFGRLCEGDVSVRQRKAFELHLETCSKCKGRWEQVAAGARYVEDVLSGAMVPRAQTNCLSQDLMAGYLADSLGVAEKRMVEEHLAGCRACQEQVLVGRGLSDGYAEEGGEWWDRYVGQQILHLIAEAPEVLNDVLAAAKVGEPARVESRAIITLPTLEPAEAVPLRLAAATGEGFSEEILRQEEPPFEFHIVQFGEQLRVTARALDEHSPYRDCLARLRFLEGESCRLSRHILIAEGEGRCTIAPEEARAVRPQKEQLRIDLEPVIGLEQLVAAGTEAYVPILERLLKHSDPGLRRHAVEILARIQGPKAGPLIEPLTGDPDETVRAVARRALTLAERKHG